MSANTKTEPGRPAKEPGTSLSEHMDRLEVKETRHLLKSFPSFLAVCFSHPFQSLESCVLQMLLLPVQPSFMLLEKLSFFARKEDYAGFVANVYRI